MDTVGPDGVPGYWCQWTQLVLMVFRDIGINGYSLHWWCSGITVSMDATCPGGVPG